MAAGHRDRRLRVSATPTAHAATSATRASAPAKAEAKLEVPLTHVTDGLQWKLGGARVVMPKQGLHRVLVPPAGTAPLYAVASHLTLIGEGKAANLVGAEDVTLLPAGPEWATLVLRCVGQKLDAPHGLPEYVRGHHHRTTTSDVMRTPPRYQGAQPCYGGTQHIRRTIRPPPLPPQLLDAPLAIFVRLDPLLRENRIFEPQHWLIASLRSMLAPWEPAPPTRGMADCPICYSLVHPCTMQTPQCVCRTCNQSFHASCVHKWHAQEPPSATLVPILTARCRLGARLDSRAHALMHRSSNKGRRRVVRSAAQIGGPTTMASPRT